MSRRRHVRDTRFLRRYISRLEADHDLCGRGFPVATAHFHRKRLHVRSSWEGT